MIAEELAEPLQEDESRSMPQLPGAGNNLVRRRALECFAITMIGDGVLGFIEPERHVQLWLRGPNWWRKMLQPFAESPQLTRWVGAAEFAFGIWLAIQQEPKC